MDFLVFLSGHLKEATRAACSAITRACQRMPLRIIQHVIHGMLFMRSAARSSMASVAATSIKWPLTHASLEG